MEGRLLSVLLPVPERLRGGFAAAPRLAAVLARSDALRTEAAGSEAQLLRHLDLLPRRLPYAALTRALDADDAVLGAWLRADPAWLRADLGSGRMMACGELGLDAAAADELLRPLRPLFGDEGFPISAPVPQRWYLALPREVQLPSMSHPDDALGDDLNAHLPAGDAGRRWRRLLNEAQIVLHNHPLNAARIAAGQPPVNSLWFWGGGALPDHVRLTTDVWSDDALLAGAAKLASRRCQPLKALLDAPPEAAALIDLRRLRDVAQLEDPWLPWLQACVASSAADAVLFDFGDGRRFLHRPSQRWRFWRRALRQ